MRSSSPTCQRLAALGLLGVALLTYPLVSLPEGEVAGMPELFAYLFGVWAGVIALAGWIAEGKGK